MAELSGPPQPHFSEATIKAVEKTLSEKSGKPYLKCLIRGKEVMAKP